MKFLADSIHILNIAAIYRVPIMYWRFITIWSIVVNSTLRAGDIYLQVPAKETEEERRKMTTLRHTAGT